ncbi:hypothetical protein HQ520_14075, partial [bacterium]|nr:hypothetical protein [bacterium]
MARDKLEEKLAMIEGLRESLPGRAAIQDLCKALEGKQNILAAAAAGLIADAGLTDLGPDLAAAFDRFMENPLQRDRQCLAKNAIIQALEALKWTDPAVFLKGVRHVQMEPVFGGRTDTADELRGLCAQSLARLQHPDLGYDLCQMLADPELQARRVAVHILSNWPRIQSELLLRLHVLRGESDPNILFACLTGLMQLEARESLEFVARFLGADDSAVVEAAALALGGSRAPGVFEILREKREETILSQERADLLLPIGLIRNDAAFDYLLSVLREEHTDQAVAA